MLRKQYIQGEKNLIKRNFKFSCKIGILWRKVEYFFSANEKIQESEVQPVTFD